MFCFKIFVGISDKWDALFLSKPFLFYISKRHCFENKIQFFDDHFDTWIVLVFKYCG